MDNIDSSKGLNDFLPIQDWFNEMHAKNTSQKVRAVLKSKGESGISLANNVPYGYKKDENDRTKWIVDEQSAEVVKEIYNLFIQGHGTFEIARILRERKILTPSEYNASVSTNSITNTQEYQYKWCGTTVAGILDRQEYIGDTVNFKYTVRSYKDKTKVTLPKEDRKIFKNTHEPIIDEYTWNIAQELRNNRKKPTRSGKKSIFSGLLFCNDCGKKMYFQSPVIDLNAKDHYRCSSYKKNIDLCTSHWITDEVLQVLVLENIQKDDPKAVVVNIDEGILSVRMEKEFIECVYDNGKENINDFLERYADKKQQQKVDISSLKEVVKHCWDRLWKERYSNAVFWKKNKCWNYHMFFLSENNVIPREDEVLLRGIQKEDNNAIVIDRYSYRYLDGDGVAGYIANEIEKYHQYKCNGHNIGAFLDNYSWEAVQKKEKQEQEQKI